MPSLFTCKLCPEELFNNRDEVQEHFFDEHVEEMAPAKSVEVRVHRDLLATCLNASADVGFAHADTVASLVRTMAEEIRSLRHAASERERRRAVAEQRQMQPIRKAPRVAQLRLPQGPSGGAYKCQRCGRVSTTKTWAKRHKCKVVNWQAAAEDDGGDFVPEAGEQDNAPAE